MNQEPEFPGCRLPYRLPAAVAVHGRAVVVALDQVQAHLAQDADNFM